MERKHIQQKKGLSKNAARQRGFKRPGFIESVVYSVSIFWEFLTGFRFISNFGKAVSFFGSARETLPERYYTDCEELAARLSTKGFAIITGGSGGIMEAANRGAHRVNGESVGINIHLPHEQTSNVFLRHSQTFRYMFSRKTILSCASEVYIFFPGGYGTLDEFFEMLTLIQVKLVNSLPIILYGKEYWEPIISFVEEKLLATYMTIDKEDARMFVILDSVDEAEYYIESLNIVQNRACMLHNKHDKAR